MDKHFSLLLDLFRFVAAALVFFYHCEQLLRDKPFNVLASFGHDAVIFFFLLSGFVIAYASTEKEKNLTDYTSARIARIYSVAIPSLILTFVLFTIGNTLTPSTYSSYITNDWFKTFITSALFINESLYIKQGLPSNAPYWSVNYEVWYYILFGISFYLKGYPKYILLVIASIIAGPRILLLFPLWLLGVFAFNQHKRITGTRLIGYLLVIFSATTYLTYRAMHLDKKLFHLTASLFGGEESINDLLHFSKFFASDYVVAILFVVLLAGIYIVRFDLHSIVGRFQPIIRILSSTTFSLYLFHYPLLIFFGALISNSILCTSITITIILLLSLITESQKHYIARNVKIVIINLCSSKRH